MGYINDYINKLKSGAGYTDLENEISDLLSKINEHYGCFSFVYAASLEKNIPEASLLLDDYYVIHDMLRNTKAEKCLVYIETRGGSGTAAEQIGRFLHANFKEVHFVISGAAMSAGTILALSGDEILMTRSGSLGPIDAQVRIGRSQVSAHDYLHWIDKKKDEAQANNYLNPVDVAILSQTSPGELRGVDCALNYAIELVREWLPKYKFKNWDKTETRGEPVTPAIRALAAEHIAKELTNQSKWRTHGRNLTIEDLDAIGLKVIKVDDDPVLADLVYRLQTVCWLLFANTTIFKIFSDDKNRIKRQAAPAGGGIQTPNDLNITQVDVVEFDMKCPDCGNIYKFFVKFKSDPNIDKAFTEKGSRPFPKNNIFKCPCGFEIDLTGVKTQIEAQAGRKIVP